MAQHGEAEEDEDGAGFPGHEGTIADAGVSLGSVARAGNQKTWEWELGGGGWGWGWGWGWSR
jgi:hypothetical protein